MVNWAGAHSRPAVGVHPRAGLGHGTASGRAEQVGQAGGFSWLGGFRHGLVSRLG